MRNFREFNDISKFRRMIADEIVATGLLAIVIDVHGQAVELVRVDTGNLKGSLSYAVGFEPGEGTDPAKTDEAPIDPPRKKNVGLVGSNVDYAANVEYRVESYLRKALDLRQKYFGEIFTKTATSVLKGRLR